MSSMVLDGASPRTRSKHPVTAVDAGRSTSKAASQAAVMDMFRVAGGSMADHELVALAEWGRLKWSPSRIRTARSELAEAGMLVLVEGTFKLTPSKRRAQVWALPAQAAA